MMRFPAGVTALVCVVTLGACGSDGPVDPETPAVRTVQVTPASSTLSSLGETVQMSALALNASGGQISGEAFTWASSNSAVGTVSSSGLLTAVGNGSVTVTATAGGVSGTAQVHVEQVVASVVIEPSDPTIAAYGPAGAVQLTALALDAGGAEVEGIRFDWSTSDEYVARVGAEGLVTTVGEGAVTITASSDGVDGTVTVSSDPPTVPTTDLVAHYSFTDGAADRSGNGHDGTVNGPVLVTDRFGNEAGAFEFDGVDDFIELAGSFSGLTVPFTFSAWMFKESLPDEGDFGHILMLHDPPSAPTSYQGIWVVVDHRFGTAYGDGGFPAGDARRSGRVTTPMAAGQWVHLAAVVTGPTDMTFYQDGAVTAADLSGTGGAMSHNSWPARIGRGTLGNSTVTFFDGLLDDLRIYNRALSEDEIIELLEEGGLG